MYLKFGYRAGNERNFTRTLIITNDAGEQREFTVIVEEAAATAGLRLCRIVPQGKKKSAWSGELPDDVPPTRALSVAAGLCDENGSIDIPPPAWAGF